MELYIANVTGVNMGLPSLLLPVGYKHLLNIQFKKIQ